MGGMIQLPWCRNYISSPPTQSVMTFNNPPKKTDDPFKSFKKPKRNFRCKHTIKRRNESKFLNLKEKKKSSIPFHLVACGGHLKKSFRYGTASYVNLNKFIGHPLVIHRGLVFFFLKIDFNLDETGEQNRRRQSGNVADCSSAFPSGRYPSTVWMAGREEAEESESSSCTVRQRHGRSSQSVEHEKRLSLRACHGSCRVNGTAPYLVSAGWRHLRAVHWFDLADWDVGIYSFLRWLSEREAESVEVASSFFSFTLPVARIEAELNGAPCSTSSSNNLNW